MGGLGERRSGTTRGYSGGVAFWRMLTGSLDPALIEFSRDFGKETEEPGKQGHEESEADEVQAVDRFDQRFADEEKEYESDDDVDEYAHVELVYFCFSYSHLALVVTRGAPLSIFGPPWLGPSASSNLHKKRSLRHIGLAERTIRAIPEKYTYLGIFDIRGRSTECMWDCDGLIGFVCLGRDHCGCRVPQKIKNPPIVYSEFVETR